MLWFASLAPVRTCQPPFPYSASAAPCPCSPDPRSLSLSVSLARSIYLTKALVSPPASVSLPPTAIISCLNNPVCTTRKEDGLPAKCVLNWEVATAILLLRPNSSYITSISSPLHPPISFSLLGFCLPPFLLSFGFLGPEFLQERII